MLTRIHNANASKPCEGDELLVLQKKIEAYENRMLTKAEVARRFGMTVSWLNNSENEIAVKLRAIGVKLGKSPSSPVRYPLSQVTALMEDN